MEAAARVTAKGQVTIPVTVRRAHGLDPGDEGIFELDPAPGCARATVRKAADFKAMAGSVPVPPEWSDSDWPAIRESAWASQAARRGPDSGA